MGFPVYEVPISKTKRGRWQNCAKDYGDGASPAKTVWL
jgi:hypothetical protein